MSATVPPCFALRIRHTFYASGVCRDFVVSPSERTRRCMAGARWVFKDASDGFMIVGSGTSATQMDEPLLFFMRLRNPSFAYFTEAVAPAPQPSVRSLAWFSPGPGANFGVAPATLVRDPQKPDKAPVIRSSAEPRETIGSASDAGEAMAIGDLFGVILLPSFSLRAGPPQPCTIQFKAREVRWVYQIDGATGLTIRNGPPGGPAPSAADAGGEIEFEKVESGGSTTFTSKALLPCSELSQRHLVLCKQAAPGRELLRLPNPSFMSLTVTGAGPTIAQFLKSTSFVD